jgi:hypothetical protein
LIEANIECENDLLRDVSERSYVWNKEDSMLTRPLLSLTALAFSAATAFAQASVQEGIPAKLAPPAGAHLIGRYAGKGVQIYVCSTKSGANEWTLKAPEAQLTDTQGKPFAKHYAGPTWKAPDGSKAVGKAVANKPSPKAGSIPWLLLSAESSGSGVLAGVHFVQRINTNGGAGPTGTCERAGTERRVDYTAEYVFYK